ncbi:hypothetical protein THAOC_20524, partial [Thalassiosira oceanica]
AQASEEYTKESAPQPHGGTGRGLHIVQPVGSTINIIEGSTSCEQRLDLGDTIPSMVQADDIHGTGGVDLGAWCVSSSHLLQFFIIFPSADVRFCEVVTTAQGEIITLESDSVPFHPLNTHSAGAARSPGSNSQSHGFSASQGIFVHPISRQYRDVLGVYLPVTFEIFDRRPNIDKEVDKQLYAVEIRAGMSAKRTVFSKTYNSVGVYTEKVQIQVSVNYAPGVGFVFDPYCSPVWPRVLRFLRPLTVDSWHRVRRFIPFGLERQLHGSHVDHCVPTSASIGPAATFEEDSIRLAGRRLQYGQERGILGGWSR